MGTARREKVTVLEARSAETQLGAVVGGEIVLGLQHLLHPVGDGADLAVHRVGDIAHRIGQVVILPVHLVQALKERHTAHGNHQSRQPRRAQGHQRRFLVGRPTSSSTCFRWPSLSSSGSAR